MNIHNRQKRVNSIFKIVILAQKENYRYLTDSVDNGEVTQIKLVHEVVKGKCWDDPGNGICFPFRRTPFYPVV